MATSSSMPNMAEQIAVEQTSANVFVSKILPQRMGNALPIAYGGCAAGIAVHSACKTVPPNFHIYSILGAFHGPTQVDRKINCTVTRTRDTKTFVTRRVAASQTQDDGSERTCLEIFVDFHVLEPAFFEYSAPPSISYGEGPTDSKHTADMFEVAETLVRKGDLSRPVAEKHQKIFAMTDALFETRQCVDGVSGQNLMGVAKQVKTTQDHLNMTEKTSAEWLKTRALLKDEHENMAALAFIMDGALSFLPLNNDHKNLEDAGPCTTLDFALRVMRPGIKMDRWHLRERKAIAAAVGRTYAESRLWDEEGNLVAIESQSCILRPPGKAKKEAKI